MVRLFLDNVGASIVVFGLVCAAPVQAETPRELLTQAGFVDRDRNVALARIDKAAAVAGQTLSRAPNDQDAAVVQAMANGYRAKLLGNRGQAIAARKQYEALVTRYPRNAEAQAALGAWHVGVIAKLGRFVGRAVAGAQKATGFEALDRSVALGPEYRLHRSDGHTPGLVLGEVPSERLGEGVRELPRRGKTRRRCNGREHRLPTAPQARAASSQRITVYFGSAASKRHDLHAPRAVTRIGRTQHSPLRKGS